MITLDNNIFNEEGEIVAQLEESVFSYTMQFPDYVHNDNLLITNELRKNNIVFKIKEVYNNLEDENQVMVICKIKKKFTENLAEAFDKATNSLMILGYFDNYYKSVAFFNNLVRENISCQDADNYIIDHLSNVVYGDNSDTYFLKKDDKVITVFSGERDYYETNFVDIIYNKDGQETSLLFDTFSNSGLFLKPEDVIPFLTEYDDMTDEEFENYSEDNPTANLITINVPKSVIHKTIYLTNQAYSNIENKEIQEVFNKALDLYNSEYGPILQINERLKDRNYLVCNNLKMFSHPNGLPYMLADEREDYYFIVIPDICIDGLYMTTPFVCTKYNLLFINSIDEEENISIIVLEAKKDVFKYFVCTMQHQYAISKRKGKQDLYEKACNGLLDYIEHK